MTSKTINVYGEVEAWGNVTPKQAFNCRKQFEMIARSQGLKVKWVKSWEESDVSATIVDIFRMVKI
jgi:hypothetical protein